MEEINLEYYKTFYYVAKYSSITQAAQALFLSQPAVSQTVRQLEKAVGCALFSRTRGGMQLTAEGNVLYFHVAKGYEQFLLGEKKIKDMLSFEMGEVRIGASDMTLQLYLLPFLESFRRQYPKIRISLTNASTPITVAELRDGKIDFGVVGSPVSEWKDLCVRSVAEIDDVFIAGRRFEPLRGKTISLRELVQYPVVCLGKDTSTRSYLDSFFEQYGLSLQSDFEVSSSDLVTPFVERNMGIGIVVRDFAREGIQKGSVFEIKTDIAIPPRRICVITGSKGAVSHAAQAFLDILR
ncbi:MAG: LysR family transcriptional regulator [Christensenella sp.]|nr:LysR family transcriptional regulator [Christensenella sp.]